MRVPVNVVTGFLGVGKTTAILDLLARKSDGERWAVLVNEYGEVGIDGTILESHGVAVREVAGGCVCCATAPYLQVALHLLMVEVRPDRIIIETTGLGHPSQLIEKLRRQYADRLEVRATIAFVSPDDFLAPGMLENPIFKEQVDVADVLVLNKLDLAEPGTVAEFQAWANGLDPAKALVAATQSGRLEREWLDLAPVEDWFPFAAPVVNEPYSSVGIVFPDKLRFDGDRLLTALGTMKSVARLKGVFRTGDGAVAIQRVGGSTTMEPLPKGCGNRLQVFGVEPPDRAAIERAVVACVSVEGERFLSGAGDGGGHGADVHIGADEARAAVGHQDARAAGME